MSLTVGPGIFGHRPTAIFNRDLPDLDGLLFLERSPRWIRGRAGGETVVDSRDARLLYEHGVLAVYLFPEEEVRMGLLRRSDRRTASQNKGELQWWDLALGDRTVENAAWTYVDPPADAPPLAGLVGFAWSALDEWLEEDEPAIVHARDPYHRVDALSTSRRVRVSLDGVTLAESERAKVIFETALPPRWYFPPEDVSTDLLEPSETTTGCAYKGFADYHSVRVGDRLEKDLAWSYAEPRREVAPIAGHIAFFDERVDLEIDGELQQRPLTPWSPEWREREPERSIEGDR